MNEAAPVPGAQPATRPTAVSALCGQGIAAHGLWRAIAMDAKTEYDASALSDTEREELIAQALRSGNLPRRGRPRKGGTQLRWADLGLDRRRVFEWKRMSKIPQADFDAFFDAQRRAGENSATAPYWFTST